MILFWINFAPCQFKSCSKRKARSRASFNTFIQVQDEIQVRQAKNGHGNNDRECDYKMLLIESMTYTWHILNMMIFNFKYFIRFELDFNFLRSNPFYNSVFIYSHS